MLNLERKRALIKSGNSTKANNVASVTGHLVAEFEFSYEVASERFYRSWVSVERFSGIEDRVPIIVWEKLIGLRTLKTSLKGKWIEVDGQFRSYNKWGKDGLRHLDLFLFANNIHICDNEDDLNESIHSNKIYLDGHICKPPIFRITPKGSEITDFMLSINRTCDRTEYIPCIAWNKEARLIYTTKDVGDQIQLVGRIQSREYFKSYSSDSSEGELRTAYEVSVWKLVNNLR